MTKFANKALKISFKDDNDKGEENERNGDDKNNSIGDLSMSIRHLLWSFIILFKNLKRNNSQH